MTSPYFPELPPGWCLSHPESGTRTLWRPDGSSEAVYVSYEVAAPAVMFEIENWYPSGNRIAEDFRARLLLLGLLPKPV